ncbi:Pogo transposable element with KRAB, partial [Stegodyphus mimosarum]
MAPKRNRSYTAGFKLNVISCAEQIGNRAAAREFEVNERCIPRWRNEKELLKNMPQQKRAKRSGTVRRPNLEDDLANWIKEQRGKGMAISTVKIRLLAKFIAKQMNINDFKEEPCWCSKFMKRKNISVRTVWTTVGQQLPMDWQDKKASFLKYVTDIIDKKKKLLRPQIINIDETPLAFDSPTNRTVDETGAKTASVLTTGHERTSFTCVLACAANGVKLKPMIIFKRKTIPKGDFPNDVIICANENGWMCETIMHEWLQKVWQCRKRSFFQPKELLIMDSMRAHLLESVKTRCQKLSTTVAIISGGLTKILQPLDLSGNESFKAEVRKRWECWMSEGLHTYTKSGKMLRASYEEVAKWVGSAWKSVKTSSIIAGFKEAEIISLDKETVNQDDECDDLEDLDLDQDLLNLLNSDSEESDFDGFIGCIVCCNSFFKQLTNHLMEFYETKDKASYAFPV